jgi:hypothetical protein
MSLRTGYPGLTRARDRRRSGQSNRPSSRRHARRTCLEKRQERSRSASDGFGWNAHDPTRPPRELHRTESARSGKPQGREESHRRRNRPPRPKRTARAAGDEAPKRDRPEAGRPGQRERRQRALQGTYGNLTRGARPNEPGPRRGTLCRASRESGRSGRSCNLRVALVVLRARRLIRRGEAVAGA